MICFLTSRTDLPDSDHLLLNPANRFVDELRRVLPKSCRAVSVSSDPDNWARTDLYAAATQTSFQNAGMPFSSTVTVVRRVGTYPPMTLISV